MIKYIKFDNFKCLSNKEFNLDKINIFTGYNGRGKSSVMQAILLLSQSVKTDEVNNFRDLFKIHLNGDFVQLGDFDELLSNEDSFEFKINLIISNSSEHEVVLGYTMTDDYKIGELCHCVIDKEDYFDSSGSKVGVADNKDGKKSLKLLPPFLLDQFKSQSLHYVAADRQGPVKFVEKQEVPEFYKVGPDGSMTINTLATYKELIPKSMNVIFEDDSEHDLVYSATSWINYIMNGGRVNVSGKDPSVDKIKSMPKSAILELGFGFGDEKRTFHSYNVGFGYSYILSIVVTALIAKANDIVIVENPEAHLHPEAQTRLTFMLAKLASRGVQVFVETHSEHVINGIRLAALKKEFELSNQDVRIFFFDRDFQKIDLRIEKNGRIDNWPNRFFDQYQKELAEILKLSAGIKS